MKRLTGAMALAIALVTVAGSAMAAKEKSELKVTIDPAFWNKSWTKIGLVGITYPVSNDVRKEEIIPDLVSSVLQEQGDFTLLFPDDIRKAAERGGFKEAYDTLARVWRTRGEIDPPSLAIVQQAINVEALVLVDLTHWDMQHLEVGIEGYATTTVGLRARMWDATDRTLVWEASLIKIGKSPPYNPSGDTAVDASGATRQSVKSIPEPPTYEQIAEEVVNEVIGSYPKPEDKEKALKAAQKKKKKEEGR